MNWNLCIKWICPSKRHLRRLHTFPDAHNTCRNQTSGPFYESYFRVSWFNHSSYSLDLPLSNFFLHSKDKILHQMIRFWQQACFSVDIISWTGAACVWLTFSRPSPGLAFWKHLVNIWSCGCSLHSTRPFPSTPCLPHTADINMFAFSSQEALWY